MFLANSSANVAWSPAKAAALALSRLSCLPVNNSASNSDSILVSNSSKALLALTISSISAPNNLAFVTASAINSGLPPN